jgi:RHS repeat-associated protein
MYDPCDDSQILSFDGNNVVKSGDDRSESVQETFSFVHGPGIDDPLLGRKGTETIIYVTNGRGEVLSFAKASGDDSDNRIRDDHPMRAGGIMDAGSFSNQRAGATSSGLSYYRNRFYDSQTGRWTQADPIGIAGGLNQHAYVGNDPVTYTDPFGLCEPFCTIMDIAFVAADINDIRQHGLSWGRGLALGGDVAAAGFPFVPALLGASVRSASSATHASRLATHFRLLETYGQAGSRTLESGRIRYYGNLTPARTPGSTVGRRIVREWDPSSGAMRTWHETIDAAGNVRVVRPETGGSKIHYFFDAVGNYLGKK